MSIDRCNFCAAFVDTDHDCDAYSLTFEDGTDIITDVCMCQGCRESNGAELLIAPYEGESEYELAKHLRPEEVKIILHVREKLALSKATPNTEEAKGER